MNIDNIVDKVEYSFSLDNGLCIDPLTILMIIEVVGVIFSTLKEVCHKDEEEIVDVLQNPSYMQKQFLRRTIRRKMGWKKWKSDGQKTYLAFLEAGRHTHREEIREVFQD